MLIAIKRKNSGADSEIRAAESRCGETIAESITSRETRIVIRFQFRGFPGVDGSFNIPTSARTAAMPPKAADNQVAKNSC